MAEGIDYSYGSGLTANAMRSAGKHFVCRYLATLPNSKCINKAEATNLLRAGLAVVLVWETTADRVLSGGGGGAADAREADRQATGLGMRGIPIYFACDIDATPGQQGAINGYCDGAASVIGRSRTGLYGGYWPVSRAFSAGKIKYGWQTYAWSGGNLDRRAQLYQYRNAVHLGPAEVDLDRSMATDYGQWPRPRTSAPAHVTSAARVVTTSGSGHGFTHTANGRDTWAKIAAGRNMRPGSFAGLQDDLDEGTADKLFGGFVPAAGAAYRTKNP
jgi:hypothetical protein